MNGTPTLRERSEHAMRILQGDVIVPPRPAPSPPPATAPTPPVTDPYAATAPAIAAPMPAAAATAPAVATAPTPPTPYAWEAPPGFAPIDQDFLFYHPDFGQGRSILGMLVDALPLWFQPSSTQPGVVVPALYGLVVQLLEPTLVLDPGASKRIVEAKPGQEIMVAADHIALRRLVRAALDPTSIGEVWLRPDPAVRLQYGLDHQAAWIALSGKTFPRESLKRSGQR